jgi:ubiquinone/menaquinone biosynthesis C-methylase UbiE
VTAEWLRGATGNDANVSDVERYWDEQASSFDEAPDHGLRDAAIRSAWASLLTPLMPPAPARIADLGCGTGSLAILLAEAGHIVSGVDVAAGMITRARAKVAAAGVDADFEVGDATTPPWPGATFDVVLARHVVWALPDRALGLGRWLEMLKPSGRLVLIEGRWWTGAGLGADELLALLRAHGRTASITPLPNAELWGGSITDERYLLVSPA